MEENKETKSCTICHQEQSVENFYETRMKANGTKGRASACKLCAHKYVVKRKEKSWLANSRKCSQCKEEKPMSEFTKPCLMCEPCKQQAKQRRQETFKRKLKAAALLEPTDKQVCKTCKVEKDISEFPRWLNVHGDKVLQKKCNLCLCNQAKNNADKRGLKESRVCPACDQEKEASEFSARVSRCKSCMIEYRNSPEVKEKAKKYRDERKEEISEYNKKHRIGYYAKNKERLLEEKKVWRRENREKNNEIIRNWRAKQRKEGGRYAIMEKLRVRFNQAIFHGKNGGRKHTSVVELLGISTEEFRDYLSSLFEEGMTFENQGRGSWVVDHIIPVNAFDLYQLEAQKECFHWSNMKPLWELENRLKSDKLLPESLEKFQELKDRGLIREDFEVKIFDSAA